MDIHTDEKKEELWEKLALFYAFYGAFYTPGEMREAYGRLTEELSAGKRGVRKDAHEAFPEIQIEDVFEALFRAKGVQADEPLVRHAGQFFRILSMDRLRLYEGTKEMLQALREHGKKVYLLSNAQKIFTEYEMQALGLPPFFDGIFISSEYGCKKPDMAFYETLLSACGVARETAVMTGNDGTCDIEGAKRAGLATVYVRTEISPDEPLPEADYILEQMDMKKLKDILLGQKN